MIPFLDIKAINARFETEFKSVFNKVLDTGYYILGSHLETFEKEYAAYCGVRHCLGVGNGLEALSLILKGYIALGKLQKGDEVLVPSNTFIASLLAIHDAGLVPVLVAPNANTFNCEAATIASAITSRTKAIMVVHLYGQLAAMSEIIDLAKNHQLLLIEDAAQAHGAVQNGVKAGAFGDAAGFSFYPSKNLGALGDAGAITTNDEALYEVVKKIRSYGASRKYYHEIIGQNSRMDELQAAILSVKLKRLDDDNEKRKQIALYYNAHIETNKIIKPTIAYEDGHVFYAYVIRCKSRDALQEYLKDHGVGTLIHYPVPLSDQAALQEMKLKSLPIDRALTSEILSLPISPVQTQEQTTTIVELINKF